MMYQKIGMGGTFDHFHKGHQDFIKFAAAHGKHLIIGITNEKLTASKKFSQTIEHFSVREQSVINFCKAEKIIFETTMLNDVYGPTLADPGIDALCVTENTYKGAEQINAKRAELELSQLPVLTAALSLDKVGKVIASERIRNGEINRVGDVYETIFYSDIVVTEKQRSVLAQPQGAVITAPSLQGSRYVVGDTSLETFLSNNWDFSLGIFDYQKQRSAYDNLVVSQDEIDLSTENPAGIISKELLKSFQLAVEQSKRYLFVKGEEDLAAVVAILLLPLGAAVYYGQPNVGLIEVPVTEAKKEELRTLLTK